MTSDSPTLSTDRTPAAPPGPTPAGEVEQRRLQGLMQQAREIPGYLDRDPVQAVAIMAALGTSVFLVEELRPHLSQLSTLMSAHGCFAPPFSPSLFFSVDATRWWTP